MLIWSTQQMNPSDHQNPHWICVCGQNLTQHVEGYVYDHCLVLLQHGKDNCDNRFPNAPQDTSFPNSTGGLNPAQSFHSSSITSMPSSSMPANIQPSLSIVTSSMAFPPVSAMSASPLHSMPMNSSMSPTSSVSSSSAMSAMSIPLSQVPPITAFAPSLVNTRNVSAQRRASAIRNLPQHAQANTATGTRGATSRQASSATTTTTTPVVQVITKVQIAVIPISVSQLLQILLSSGAYTHH